MPPVVESMTSTLLTSQDREGDTVTYSVSKIGSVNPLTLNVNSQTGVVTITPPGFTAFTSV
ncbi:MAG: hypothetical protein U0930_19470 [Pirellulales bacterium]